jgi:hypothetical protein
MNEERPGQPKVDGRPFDGGLGPTAQATEGVPIGRPQLSAQQIHGEDGRPSWMAPRERTGMSTAALIGIVIAVAAVVLLLLWVAGAI